MANSNLILFLSIISIYCVIQHASSLISEGIANGEYGPRINFTYQAAVVGREREGGDIKLLGNGALVHHDWALCVAQSFVEDSKKKTLKKYIFKISIGTGPLTEIDALRTEHNIIEIHIPGYNASTLENDIVMVKFEVLEKWEKRVGYPLEGPKSHKSLIGHPAKVSGYGDLGSEPTSYSLYYIYVQITSSSECAMDFPDVVVDEEKHVCGRSRKIPGKITGVCPNDIGSPLVAGSKIVGLVTKAHANCDDSERGALYISISGYIDFIGKTLLGIKMEGVDVIPMLSLETLNLDE